jgi:hypothetical protein
MSAGPFMLYLTDKHDAATLSSASSRCTIITRKMVCHLSLPVTILSRSFVSTAGYEHYDSIEIIEVCFMVLDMPMASTPAP